ncbi:MAG: hypothetical protein AB7E12_12615 [Burkholderiaceae bacterium]
MAPQSGRLRYVHTEDVLVRKATELVANRRKTVVAGKQPGQQAREEAASA